MVAGRQSAVAGLRSPVCGRRSPVCRISNIDNRQSTIDNQKARDWPTFTCSVNPNITQDRHKHRLKAPDWLIEMRPTGIGMPVREAWGLRLAACGLELE
jgi:hypothetical protein